MRAEVERLVELLEEGSVAVLTGAGCSTESGIPDYRGPATRRRARNPIQYREFVSSAEARRRYWARSAIGWRLLASARPNPGHLALAAMEASGRIAGLVTQNVDRLHLAAGSRRVVELHGALAEVACLECGAIEQRAQVQERILELNPAFGERAAEDAPDGDAELPAELVAGFRVPGCLSCGGALKPKVVFFGENVPRPIVDAAWRVVNAARALLVVGSSLEVFSGFRFARGAAERGLPIAIVNLGPTRADPLADLRVNAPAGELLPLLAEALALV